MQMVLKAVSQIPTQIRQKKYQTWKMMMTTTMMKMMVCFGFNY
jgi:hypothetical protein